MSGLNLRIVFLLAIVFLAINAKGQITPKEGSLLNYRLIGFSFPPEPGISDYRIEIACGDYNSEDSFGRNIYASVAGNTNKIIAEVPSFGSAYTWRIVYASGQPPETKSALYHFRTGIVPEVDTNNYRLSITKTASAFKDAYVFSDIFKVLYDMNGRPVWYLPPREGIPPSVVDLKISPAGTITFLCPDNAYEISYDGTVLWKAPNNGKVSGQGAEKYHHEFTKLANGHYMVLGSESIDCRLFADSTVHIVGKNTGAGKNDSNYLPVSFGTLIEYDRQGNVVWSWETMKYYEKSDLMYYVPSNKRGIADVHENSFFFDEKNKMIYLNCKNISRIIKIKYPEGTVVNEYGETYKPGAAETGNGLFCGEHSISTLQDGSILLFNNNHCNPGLFPKIEKLRQPVSKTDSLKIVWEYECSGDINYPSGFPTGGNVNGLPGDAVFISMAVPGNRLLIVSQDKDLIWSAQTERRVKPDKWMPFAQYRASIIPGRKEMEELIWNSGPSAGTEIYGTN